MGSGCLTEPSGNSAHMTMNYNITRKCWCESTFNGYADAPYWLISFSSYTIGLSDDGQFWTIGNSSQDAMKSDMVTSMLNRIIAECRLNVSLKNL